ncbi:MAG: hypothetical protein L0Y55_03245 [Anaerolineales bacterium]|nr:hypothetical protein [Anaerolineales bacterium]
MSVWLLLHYKIPTHPTARRVYIWRKLQRLGAILLHDAVWVLPANSRTREQLQWLTCEITELRGAAFLWQGQLLQGTQEDALIQHFTARTDQEYQKILSALKHAPRDLTTLSRRFQQVQSQDYFQSPLADQVRQTLVSAREGVTR